MSKDEQGESAEGGSLLLNQPVVIDNGTASLKAGFAGSTKPKVVVGTKVGRAKHMRIMPGGALEADHGSSTFVGRKLDDHRGSFILEYPMDKGAVVDGGWDAMESLWEVSRSIRETVRAGSLVRKTHNADWPLRSLSFPLPPKNARSTCTPSRTSTSGRRTTPRS